MTLTAERVREVLHYDPETGVFTQKVRTSSRVKVGGVVGGTNAAGYRMIHIDNQRHYSHRLAWLYMTNEWPSKQMDHINGIRSDNRFANLRQATSHENARNVKRQSNSALCWKGISFDKNKKKWMAKITVEGHQINLGYFPMPQIAHFAYVMAAEKYFGEFARAA
jgi:hypothetical protein